MLEMPPLSVTKADLEQLFDTKLSDTKYKVADLWVFVMDLTESWNGLGHVPTHPVGLSSPSFGLIDGPSSCSTSHGLRGVGGPGDTRSESRKGNKDSDNEDSDVMPVLVDQYGPDSDDEKDSDDKEDSVTAKDAAHLVAAAFRGGGISNKKRQQQERAVEARKKNQC